MPFQLNWRDRSGAVRRLDLRLVAQPFMETVSGGVTEMEIAR